MAAGFTLVLMLDKGLATGAGVGVGACILAVFAGTGHEVVGVVYIALIPFGLVLLALMK